MKRYDVPYIITTQSGWDDTPRTLGHGNNTPWVRTDNNVKLFERSLREGKKLIDPSLPLFLIEAWNEWGEGSFIEPGKKFGFTQLDAIRKVFSPSAKRNSWAKPTDKQVLSYSVFEGDELAAARAKEKEDPPPVPPRHIPPVEVITDPKLLPLDIVDKIKFNSSFVKKYSASFGDLEILKYQKNSLICKVKGSDPKISLNKNWGKFADIKGIAVKFKYSDRKYDFAQLFWETSETPMSEKSSRRFKMNDDGKSHVYFLKFKKDFVRTGDLKTIRVDFEVSHDLVVEIEWLKVIGKIATPKIEKKL